MHAFLALAPCLAGPSSSDDLADRLQRLEAALEKERVALHVPGCAIAIVREDRVIFAKGLGLADLETGRPVTPETVFAVGSTTKAFTATLAGMLVDEGALGWDAPITELLPDFRLPIRTEHEDAFVTLRDLLAHRTGFARADVLWASGLADETTILATMIQAEPWDEFREAFHYNNIMYLAAGEAIERAAGKSWSELVRERILAPLSMDDTTLSVEAAREDPRLARGYAWNDDAGRFDAKPMRAVDAVGPAGALNSNVLDMAQWVRFQLGRGALEGKRAISEAAHGETWEQQIGIGGVGGYGLGWFLREWNGQRVIEHGGNIDGFSAQVAMLPESNVGFVLLMNVGATPLQQSSMPLVWEALLGEEAAPGERADRALYVGTYLANFGVLKNSKLTVLEKDGKLAVDVPGQMVYTLKEPGADGLWVFELTDQIAVSFVRDASERVTTLCLHQGGAVFEAPREGVEIPPEIDLEDARRFLGAYRDTTKGEEVTVVIQNNRLAVDVPKQMVFELHAPDADGKRALRIDAALAVRFDEEADGTVRGLTFHERGDEHTYERVAGAAAPPLELAALHELRGADAREAAIDALGAYRMRGTVRLVHAGVTGTTTLVGEGTERWRTSADLGPFGSVDTCYDRGFAAAASSFAPYDEPSGKTLARMRFDHPLASLFDWRGFYERIEVLRADELDGRATWVVALEASDGVRVTAWVDAETGDTLREDTAKPVPGLGEIPSTTRYGDFRPLHGLRVPHRIESVDDVSGKTTLLVEMLEGGQPLAAGDFRTPKPPPEKR